MKRTAGNPGGKPNPNAGRKSKREHTVEYGKLQTNKITSYIAQNRYCIISEII
jgi:hypothetical protein